MAVEEIAYPERRYGVVGILELKPGAGADGSELLARATYIKKLYDEGEFDSIWIANLSTMSARERASRTPTAAARRLRAKRRNVAPR
jgi:hypothetical protein